MGRSRYGPYIEMPRVLSWATVTGVTFELAGFDMLPGRRKPLKKKSSAQTIFESLQDSPFAVNATSIKGQLTQLFEEQKVGFRDVLYMHMAACILSHHIEIPLLLASETQKSCSRL